MFSLIKVTPVSLCNNGWMSQKKKISAPLWPSVVIALVFRMMFFAIIFAAIFVC